MNNKNNSIVNANNCFDGVNETATFVGAKGRMTTWTRMRKSSCTFLKLLSYKDFSLF